MIHVTECPCNGKSLPRLLRPGIMALLARGEAHGYQIAQHLADMRMFTGREPDPAGIYRALKEMTDEGLVTSTWCAGDVGPAKRVFELTDDGATCLETWTNTLCDYRDAISELLDMLRKDQGEASQ